MLHTAVSISQLVHQLGKLDTVAVKVASVDGSLLAQKTVATGADALYNVIVKEAQEFAPSAVGDPQYLTVLAFIDKVASTIGRPTLTTEQGLKLASVVAVDDALTMVMQQGSPDEANKLAEVRNYGREFFMELLREVL